MPGAWKDSNNPAGRYRVWYNDERGKRKFARGYTDRKLSLKLAEELEAQARRVREGLAEPGEKARKAAASVPLADHAEDWRLQMLASGDTPRHAKHQAGAALRLLTDAGARYPEDVAPEAVRLALGRMRQRRSPRTCNHALGAVKAFARWLVDANRLREVPRGLLKLSAFSEEVDRRRVRRALTVAELARLLEAAERGETRYVYGPTRSKHHKVAVTGPDRALLYRLAMGTGFRADELRSLRPEWFHLDDPAGPTIVIPAEYTKNGKPAPQPIRRELADALRPAIAAREPGRPALVVPDRTADMLKADLAAAGIPYRDAAGRVVDFHALRHSYVTHLIQQGLSVAVVQKLARHSTPVLTLSRYTHVEQEELRKALEGAESPPEPTEGA